MEEWIESSLSSIIATLESGTRPKGGVTTDSGEVPSLGGENILQSGGISLKTVKKVTQSFYDKMTKGHLIEGDVLINKDGANTGKLGMYKGFCLNKACINEHLFLIRAKEEVDNTFLYYFLLLEQTQQIIRNKISGSAQPGLNSGFIKDFPFNYPKNKKEQSTIATILTTIDQAIEKTEQLIAKYERIKTGLVQDLLTRGIDEEENIRSEETHEFKDSLLGRIPVEWDDGVVKDFLTYISYGFTNPMPTTEHGPVMITAANIFNGAIQYKTCRLTAQRDFDTILTAKSKPQIGDVLITKDGTLGRMAIADRENICINQSVAVLRVKPEKIENAFFKTLLESPKYQKMIMDDSGGSTIKHIYITKLDKMPIAVPKEISEQKRILNFLNQIQKTIKTYVHQLENLKNTKKGLMQDLLTGKVRVDKLINKKKVK